MVAILIKKEDEACTIDQIWRWGIKGMKWGIRCYQNKDGTLTEAGEKRYKQDVTANDKKKTASKVRSGV